MLMQSFYYFIFENYLAFLLSKAVCENFRIFAKFISSYMTSEKLDIF